MTWFLSDYGNFSIDAILVMGLVFIIFTMGLCATTLLVINHDHNSTYQGTPYFFDHPFKVIVLAVAGLFVVMVMTGFIHLPWPSFGFGHQARSVRHRYVHHNRRSGKEERRAEKKDERKVEQREESKRENTRSREEARSEARSESKEGGSKAAEED